MINSVSAYPISNYFNPDGPQSFFIPKYQREYVWRKDNWEALFNDFDEAEPGHFLGSIICVNKQVDGMAGSRLELIDGQQRFMTISLLLCALYRRLNGTPDKDDDLHVELINLRNRLFVKSTGGWRFEPTEQSQNKADFQNILSQLFPKLAQPPRGLKNFGNRRIARACAYFTERLTEIPDGHALDILEKLKAAVLVKIEVPSYSDAFTLFETINNRGIPLSPIDIIKNNLLAALEKKPDYGIDRAFDEWKDLIETLLDPAVQERFLRQLYNVFKYFRRVEIKGYPRATRSNLIRIYETLTQRQPLLLFKQLQSQGRVYATLLTRANAATQWGEPTAAALQDLHRLGAAPAYALLLWISYVARAKHWDDAAILCRTTGFLTKWYFWRNLTDTPATRELEQLFMTLIADLRGRLRRGDLDDPEHFVLALTSGLMVRAPSDETCETRLSGDVYLENYEAIRFMLCKIEEAHQTRESQVDLWKVDSSDRPVFTVEHILPKTENLSQSWIDILGASSAEDAEAVRQRCAHQLGNLTLSGYNSRLGKMDFVRKRDRTNDRGDRIGYKNGLYLNRDLATRDDWNEDAIRHRTDDMIGEIKSILGLLAVP